MVAKVNKMQLGQINVCAGNAVMDEGGFDTADGGVSPARTVGVLVAQRRQQVPLVGVVVGRQRGSSAPIFRMIRR